MISTKTKTTILATLALIALPGAARAQNAVAQGAQVWANNCVRCHNARPSAERTDLQWLVIVNHMRARANLTKGDARTVTAFLQATNLPETPQQVPELPPEGGASRQEKEVEKEGKSGGEPAGTALVRALRRYLEELGGR